MYWHLAAPSEIVWTRSCGMKEFLVLGLTHLLGVNFCLAELGTCCEWCAGKDESSQWARYHGLLLFLVKL